MGTRIARSGRKPYPIPIKAPEMAAKVNVDLGKSDRTANSRKTMLHRKNGAFE